MLKAENVGLITLVLEAFSKLKFPYKERVNKSNFQPDAITY